MTFKNESKIILLLAIVVVVLIAMPITKPTSNIDLSHFNNIGFWNGFNDHIEIVECNNPTDKEIQLKFDITHDKGLSLGSGAFSMPPFGTNHLILNNYDIGGKYGSIQLDQLNVSLGQKSNIPCYNFTYKKTGDKQSYVINNPFGNFISGVSFGIFNSMNPETHNLGKPNRKPVYNWLTIYNPAGGSAKFEAQIQKFDQNGKSETGESLPVTLLAGERQDYPLGHEQGEVVGTYMIKPSNSNLQEPYKAFLNRYLEGENGEFVYALTVASTNGYSDTGPIFVSTMGGALNWLEIANFKSEAQTILVELYDQVGTLLLKETHSVNSLSQFHLFVNKYLGNESIGIALVKSLSENPAIGVQSFYYGKNSGTGELDWAYNTGGYGGEFVSSLSLPINTNLGTPSWLKVVGKNIQDLTPIRLAVYDQNGVKKSIGHYEKLDVKGTMDIPIHEIVGYDFSGSLLLSSIDNSQEFLGQIVRVYQDASVLQPGLDVRKGSERGKNASSGINSLTVTQANNANSGFQASSNGGPKYYKCENLQCKEFPGEKPPGHINCGIDRDCYDSTCNNTTGQCEKVEGQGTSHECHDNFNCQHKGCDVTTGTCKYMPGKGSNECITDISCSGPKNVCRQGTCALAFPSDPDYNSPSCSGSQDCTYMACDAGFCEQKTGRRPEGHVDCGVTSGVKCGYNDCFNDQCKRVPEENTDKSDKCELGKSNQCGHLACEGPACVFKPGPLQSNEKPCALEASVGGNCADSYCEEGQCKFKEGSGEDLECISSKYCPTPEPTLEDPNATPMPSGARPKPSYPAKDPGGSGGGIGFKVNQCTSGGSCVSGFSLLPFDECGNDSDCQHLDCVDDQCKTVPGGWTPDLCNETFNWPCKGWFPNPLEPLFREIQRSVEADESKYTKILESAYASLANQGSDSGYGNKYSLVKVDIYFDFSCPMCRLFLNESLPRLNEDFVRESKIFVNFVDFPLSDGNGLSYSKALYCAKEQNSYMLYLLLLNSKGKDVSVDKLTEYADQMGLKADFFDSCLKSNRPDVYVSENRKDAAALGINGTPTFIISDKKRIDGAGNYDALKQAIQAEIDGHVEAAKK